MKFYLTCLLLSMAACMSMSAMQEKTQETAQQPQATFMHNLIRGACAGALEVVVNNPLIVLKNQLILAAKDKGSQATVAAIIGMAEAARPGVFMHRFGQSVQKYYKGCGTGIASMAPITAFQNGVALFLTEHLGSNPTIEQKTLAAFIAGFSSALLSSPADLLVLQRGISEFKHERLLQTWNRVLGVGGLRGMARLYRGFTGTALRDGVFTAGYKTGGALLQPYNPIHTGNQWWDTVLCNALAGVIAAAISQPVDVITARMKSDLSKNTYKNTLQTAQLLMEKEGPSALFKGLVPRGSRIFLAIPLLSILTDEKASAELIDTLKSSVK